MVKSWKQMPVGTYLRLCDILEKQRPEEIDEVMTQRVEVVALLAGMTVEEVNALPVATFAELNQQAEFINDPIPPTSGRAIPTVICDGWELVPVEVAGMTTAQFIDFQTFAKNVGSNLVQLLSVVLVPKGKQYNNGYDIAEVQRVIAETLPITTASDITAFFFEQCKNSLRGLEHSLAKIGKTMTRGKREKLKAMVKYFGILFPKNGAGFTR